MTNINNGLNQFAQLSHQQLNPSPSARGPAANKQSAVYTTEQSNALKSSQVQDVLNKLQNDYVAHASTDQLKADQNDAYQKFQAQVTANGGSGLSLEQFTSFAQRSAAKDSDRQTLSTIFASLAPPPSSSSDLQGQISES